MYLYIYIQIWIWYPSVIKHALLENPLFVDDFLIKTSTLHGISQLALCLPEGKNKWAVICRDQEALHQLQAAKRLETTKTTGQTWKTPSDYENVTLKDQLNKQPLGKVTLNFWSLIHFDLGRDNYHYCRFIINPSQVRHQ